MDIILSFNNETMKLLGSTESKITKDKNGENVPHLDITELVLVHCNLVNNDYQQYSRIYICSKQTIWQFIKKFHQQIISF